MKRFLASVAFLITAAVLVIHSQNIGGANASGNLTFNGTVSGVTASPGDNTTKFATTAFVQNAAAAAANAMPRPNTRRWSYMVADDSNGVPATKGPGDFIASQTTNGATTGGGPTSTTPVFMNVSTGAATSANAKFGGNPIYETGTNILFQSYVQGPSSYTTVRVWVGVSANNLNGSDTPAVNFAAFRASTNASDTDYQCVTGDGSSTTVTNSGVVVDTNYHRFQVKFNDSVPNVQFTIDGTLVCTNTTHLPSASTALQFLTQIDLPTGSASRSISLAWAYVESDR